MMQPRRRLERHRARARSKKIRDSLDCGKRLRRHAAGPDLAHAPRPPASAAASRRSDNSTYTGIRPLRKHPLRLVRSPPSSPRLNRNRASPRSLRSRVSRSQHAQPHAARALRSRLRSTRPRNSASRAAGTTNRPSIHDARPPDTRRSSAPPPAIPKPAGGNSPA